MATLAATRVALAELLSAVPFGSSTLSVRAKVAPGDPKPGDGWVVVRSIGPGPRFGLGKLAELEALVVVGTTEAAGEAAIDSVAGLLLEAVIESDLPASAYSVTPQTVITGTTVTAPLYCLVLAVTIETE